MAEKGGVDDEAEGAEERGETGVSGLFFQAGEDVIHRGSWGLLGVFSVAEDGIEGGEADEAANDQRGHTQPRFQLGQHRERDAARRSKQAGEGGGGLVRVHG